MPEKSINEVFAEAVNYIKYKNNLTKNKDVYVKAEINRTNFSEYLSGTMTVTDQALSRLLNAFKITLAEVESAANVIDQKRSDYILVIENAKRAIAEARKQLAIAEDLLGINSGTPARASGSSRLTSEEIFSERLNLSDNNGPLSGPVKKKQGKRKDS